MPILDAFILRKLRKGRGAKPREHVCGCLGFHGARRGGRFIQKQSLPSLTPTALLSRGGLNQLQLLEGARLTNAGEVQHSSGCGGLSVGTIVGDQHLWRQHGDSVRAEIWSPGPEPRPS